MKAITNRKRRFQCELSHAINAPYGNVRLRRLFNSWPKQAQRESLPKLRAAESKKINEMQWLKGIDTHS